MKAKAIGPAIVKGRNPLATNFLDVIHLSTCGKLRFYHSLLFFIF